MYFLKDKKVKLRKLSLEDNIDSYLTFINDVDNLKWLDGTGYFPMNREDIKKHIENNKNLFLAIFDHEDTHVGTVQLANIDFVHRNALIGMLIGKEFQRKGYAKRAFKLIIKHGFEVLNLHRLYGTLVPKNKNSVAMLESLGFVEEGKERDIHLHGFKYYNGIRYSLLESDYKKLRNSIYKK